MVPALLLMSGCSSGAYDQAHRESIARYVEDSRFQRLHKEPQTLADGRLSLRVPKLFSEQDDKGDKERSKPPFLKDFPGYRVAHKALVEAGGVKLPVVLTVGALLDAESVPDAIKKRLLDQVQKEKAFAKAAWPAAAGGDASWTVLKLAGEQPFDRVKNDGTETRSDDGETQIWLASDPETKVSVILVWRLPAALAPTVPLDELADLVSRTVQVMPAAEPAAEPAAPAPPAAPAK
ncbi:MAG: hypothetical protein EBX36_06415 [Planctomycetia bacterium]|nr:hypothetical protein [Planctomycetia bacterium]